MMRRSLAVFAMFVGSCTQTLLAADKTGPTDDRLVDQVRMRLAVDQDVKGGALEVSVKDGVVTIKGRVDTDKAKSRATHIAKKVKGVKTVDNELLVGPPTS